MKAATLTPDFSVSGQLEITDLAIAAAKGYKTIINNRPDHESNDQPTSEEMSKAAEAAGLAYYYLPVVPNQLTPQLAADFATILKNADKPALAFCRTGNRSGKLFELSQQIPTFPTAHQSGKDHRQIVIVGGGAGGIATAASLLKRDRQLQITIIEPQTHHYYQPGWTLVGGGVFTPQQTVRSMASVMPKGIEWLQDKVTTFEPDNNHVALQSGRKIHYDYLIVAPGIKLDWNKVEGLAETLGTNGVTSNYDLNYAPATWQNIQTLHQGRAVFTQPPMPIKCAGAPQKAMYQAAYHWQQQGRLNKVDIQFFNAGAVLFGVPDYVPALEQYIKQYGIDVQYNHNLVKVDGPARKAFFSTSDSKDLREVDFDMLHVSPPQTAPDFIRQSPLANEAGWVDVDSATLQHNRYNNIFSLGDAASTPNAKTAAAVRKQAPVVAHNLLSLLRQGATVAHYDGYGSCPLIVERGKVILAEFGYGGKLLPSVPKWMLNGTKATRSGWILKAHMLPPIYFDLMLKGHEWLASPQLINDTLKTNVSLEQ